MLDIQDDVVEIAAPVEKEVAPTPAPGPTPEAPAPKEVAPPAEGEITAAAPAFKPREKFKYRMFESDEQKEENVPDWLKTAMKDADTEKEAIALLEKAYGLEPVKASRAAVAKERDHFKTEHTKIQGTIEDVRKTYQRGDFDAFLAKLAIPPERVLQWAFDKVSYSQLPPDQQRTLDERTEAQRRAWAAEQQTMTVEQQLQEQGRQAKQYLLQSCLARPDVRSFAESFDTQAGKPGAFFEEIKATGQLAWASSDGKVDLTPDQAVEQVMKKWSRFIPQKEQAPSPQAPNSSPSQVVTPTRQPGTIPNVQGGSKSPMKAGPKSIDDIRKIRDQFRT